METPATRSSWRLRQGSQGGRVVWGQLLTLTFELTLNLRQAGGGGSQLLGGWGGGTAVRHAGGHLVVRPGGSV